LSNNVYIGLSGQLAMQRRLETIANNVANTNTPGFRADEIRFETLLSRQANDPVSFVKLGDTFLNRVSGGVSATGNPLDVAIDGDAWLSISTKAGTVYTRDGRATLSTTGELQSVTGAPFLDPGGAPITVDPAAGPITISREGRILQNGRQLAALGLFTIPTSAKLTRVENSGVMPDVPAEAVVDFARVGVLQGHVESSNVDPVKEISRMITVQRSFDAMTTTLGTVESIFDNGIRDLGSTK
jgi:flagellar basal-body rod protein FlgF